MCDEDSPKPNKIPKIYKEICVLCGKSTPVENLTHPKTLESWKVLLNAAQIRNFQPILQIGAEGQDIPKIKYESKCRNEFTHKKSLEKLKPPEDASGRTECVYRRSSLRQPDVTASTVFPKVCIFCESNKYVKGSRTREKLIQCVDLRADENIRSCVRRIITTSRSETQSLIDERILAVTTRDIVAAEAHYHKSCYIDYTRQRPQSESEVTPEDVELNAYIVAEKKSYQNLFSYVRNDVISYQKVVRVAQLINVLKNNMYSQGIKEIKASTKKHIRHKLEQEFGESIQIFSDKNGKLFVIPGNWTLEKLAQEYIELKENLELFSRKENEVERLVDKTALIMRSEIKKLEKKEQMWPPFPCELDEKYVEIPEHLILFLRTLLSGETNPSKVPYRVNRLASSFAQDLIYGATCGKVLTAKHILLPWAVKTLTGNVQVMEHLNRLGHGISYSKFEEIDTALCLQKIESEEDGKLVLPSEIFVGVPSCLAFDNIDRLEETLTGSGTTHRVNGILIQPQVSYAPLLPHQKSNVIAKCKRRSIPSQHTVLQIYDSKTRKSPPASTPIPATAEENIAASQAKNKNFMWVMARQQYIKTSVYSWTGFNVLSNQGKPVVKDTISYLPTIHAPATQMSTVYHILEQVKQIRAHLHIPEIVCVFDQALYAKASEVVWNRPEEYENVILRMGTFHTICVMLSIVGKRFGDAGLRDVAVESDIVAEGSANSVLEGRHYNRGIRLHKIVYEALHHLLWSKFLIWVEENHQDQKPVIEEATKQIEDFSHNPCDENQSSVLRSSQFDGVAILYEKFQKEIIDDTVPTASLWLSYIDMIEIILDLIRASREGNWNLHISAIRRMIPWCFAYDKHNYARYLAIYLAQMTRLEIDHPYVHEQLISGGFSVQLSEHNPFSKIPVDQAIEETVNRDTQTSGGTTGFSLKSNTVSKYYLTAEYRSICIRQLRQLSGTTLKTSYHHDFGSVRKTKDEISVKAVVELLDNDWVNPFENQMQDMVSLSSGISASEDVKNDLLRGQELGSTAYNSFVESRLKEGKNFYEPLKKMKLKTFSSMREKKKTTRGNVETVLMADHQLFSRMLLLASTRKLDMKDVLKHPLGPLPWALANCDGSLKKTNKSALGRHIEQLTQPQVDGVNINPSATIIDGMAMLHKIVGENHTFSEISEILLRTALQHGKNSDRVDVVFDVYQENSIKQFERQRRTSSSEILISKIIPSHKVKNWRRVLSSTTSKNVLTQYFVDDWKSKQQVIGQKKVFVTQSNKCFLVTKDQVEEVECLKCSQEEADTRIFLHAKHAAHSQYLSVIIVSEDTDVLILSLAFCSIIGCDIYMRLGTKNRTRLIFINKMASHLGSATSLALPGLHAFTGCDTVSSFSGQSKIKGFKLLVENEEFKNCFTHLGDEWQLSEEVFKGLQVFTCKLYASRTDREEVNDLRYDLWRAKKGLAPSSSLPPCKDTLNQHALRANYQCAIWKRSLKCDPNTPSPQNFGWSVKSDRSIEVQWMTGLPAPLAVLDMLACKCKKACTSCCECVTNSMNCTDACKCNILWCNNRDSNYEVEEEETIEFCDDSDVDY